MVKEVRLCCELKFFHQERYGMIFQIKEHQFLYVICRSEYATVAGYPALSLDRYRNCAKISGILFQCNVQSTLPLY